MYIKTETIEPKNLKRQVDEETDGKHVDCLHVVYRNLRRTPSNILTFQTTRKIPSEGVENNAGKKNLFFPTLIENAEC